jgi:hypothetical protein
VIRRAVSALVAMAPGETWEFSTEAVRGMRERRPSNMPFGSECGRGWSRRHLGQRREAHGTRKNQRGDQEGRSAAAADARVFDDQPARRKCFHNSVTVHAAGAANVGAGDRLLVDDNRQDLQGCLRQRLNLWLPEAALSSRLTHELGRPNDVSGATHCAIQCLKLWATHLGLRAPGSRWHLFHTKFQRG